MSKLFILVVILGTSLTACSKMQSARFEATPRGTFVDKTAENTNEKCAAFEKGTQIKKIEKTIYSVQSYTPSYSLTSLEGNKVKTENIDGLILTFKNGKTYVMKVKPSANSTTEKDQDDAIRNLLLMISNSARINVTCKASTLYTTKGDISKLNFMTRSMSRQASENVDSDIDGIITIQDLEI